jgi:c-di-AMP phosphodiesterase-like protein
MFFLYEVILVLTLILFFLSYSKLKVNNKIKNLQHQSIIMNNLIDTMDDGFYIWDAKKRIEKFSPNLLILFNTVFYSFNEFVNFFEQSESLIKNFTEAKEINKSFTLDLKAKDSEVYCTCYGRSIIDNSNNVIGALLWIRNNSDYKIKANGLELENNKIIQEVESYKNIFNSLPYPILKYNKHKKVKFYNLFYDKYINNSQRSAITNSVYNAQLGKYVITCNNERKTFDFIKIAMQDYDEIVVYGKDVSDTEKLHNKLNDYLVTQNKLLEELPVAIAIYSKDQKIKFYNNSFIKIFQFDIKFLESCPTYYEVMLDLESKKLLKKEDFQFVSKQRHKLFKELIDTYNDMLHLTSGKVLRVLVMLYASEGLLFYYEECKR